MALYKAYGRTARFTGAPTQRVCLNVITTGDDVG